MSEPMRVRVPGHTLPYEGKILRQYRWSNGPGKAKCSCGAESALELESTAARKRWHREHKRAVIDAG